MGREDITEKVAFEQRFEKGEGELLWEGPPLPCPKGPSQVLTHPTLSSPPTARRGHSLSVGTSKNFAVLLYNLFSESGFLTQIHVFIHS